jgi:putative ABC transport system permease protein
VVSALDHKAWHDLGRMRGQAVAIAALVACAVAAWVSTALTERAMGRSRDAFYAAERFADVFASLRRAPEGVAARVAALPGVAEVETRVVWPGRLELPGGGHARALFVSVPGAGPPRLNGIVVRAGRALLPGERGAALASEGFAEANGLAPGDALAAVVNGRRERLRLAGAALSPEHVYAIGPGMIFPDDRRFAVIWMPREDLAAAAGMDGAFNSLALRLTPRASEREVIRGVDALLDRWGGRGAHGRADQVSHRYVSNEILQLRATAVVVPAIFAGVAAFLLSVIVSRLVAMQRQQIGMLKALGYGDGAVALHYAKLVGAVVLAGAAAGALAGVALERALAAMYARFFRFPAVVHDDAAAVVAAGVTAAVAAAALGVAGAVWRAARLAPAEAMRPEPPAAFHRTRFDALPLVRSLPPAWKMVARSLARRPVRAALSAGGIACGVAVLVVAGSMQDSLTHLLRLHFQVASAEDAAVAFAEPTGPDAVLELRGIAGVRAVEPVRDVAATLRHGARTYRAAVSGVDPGGALRRLVDVRGAVVHAPPAGVVLSAQLARILDVRTGEEVAVEVHEGARRVLTLRVAALVEDFAGVAATMSRAALNAALGEGDLASGALLSVEPGSGAAVEARVAERPRVAEVTLTAESRRSMEAVIQRSMGGFLAVLAAFALVLAGSVVYNATRVAHAERERELATLRVLGFTTGEAWRVLAAELAVLAVAAVPAGWALGAALMALSARGLSSDLFRLPVVVSPATFLLAGAWVLGAAAALVLVARRWVGRADLVEVLKARE